MRVASAAAGLLFFLCACVLSVFNAGARQGNQIINAGYRSLSYSLPHQHIMLKISVWYPAKRKPGNIKEGVWNFRAARNASALPGPWPLIVLSHDNTGTSLSHHDIASALAAKGYVVVAPTHDRDNADDMALLFHDRELWIRALQLHSALDFILDHPQLGPIIDRSRIGFLGFGSQAPAGFLLAGATTVGSEWEIFCSSSQQDAAEPEQTDIDFENAMHTADPAGKRQAQSPWCAPILSHRIDRLIDSLQHRSEQNITKKRYAEAAAADRIKTFKRISDSIMRYHQRILRLNNENNLPPPPVALPLLPPPAEDSSAEDVRFKALAMVSPGFSFLFDADSLSHVSIPVLLIGAGKDKLNIPHEQAERFASMLKNAEYDVFSHADACAFQAACPEGDPAYPLSSLCRSVDDDERTSLHQQLVWHATSFFSRYLTEKVEQ